MSQLFRLSICKQCRADVPRHRQGWRPQTFCNRACYVAFHGVTPSGMTYRNNKAAGRCVECVTRLPDGHKKSRCESCLRLKREEKQERRLACGVVS